MIHDKLKYAKNQRFKQYQSTLRIYTNFLKIQNQMKLMQYGVCGKCLHLMENHIEKQEEDVIVEEGKCKEKGCTCNGYGRVPHAKITIEDLKESYKTNDNIEFAVRVRGFGSHSGLPNVWIRQLKDTKRQKIMRQPKHELSYLLESTPQYVRNVWSKLMTPKEPNSTLEDFERTMKFPSINEPPIIIKERGQYELCVSVIPNEKKQTFEVN